MIKYLKLSFLVVFFSGTLFAQQSSVYTHDLTEFNRAVELYKDKQYQAAQILFDKEKTKTNNQEVEADCAYYIANCAIRLNQSGCRCFGGRFCRRLSNKHKNQIKLILVWHITILTKEIIQNR
jgi:predicted HicB family RNase H-like nuclease